MVFCLFFSENNHVQAARSRYVAIKTPDLTSWLLGVWNSEKMLYLCRCENCADFDIAIQGVHGHQSAGCTFCASGSVLEP